MFVVVYFFCQFVHIVGREALLAKVLFILFTSRLGAYNH